MLGFAGLHDLQQIGDPVECGIVLGEVRPRAQRDHEITLRTLPEPVRLEKSKIEIPLPVEVIPMVAPHLWIWMLRTRDINSVGGYCLVDGHDEIPFIGFTMVKLIRDKCETGSSGKSNQNKSSSFGTESTDATMVRMPYSVLLIRSTLFGSRSHCSCRPSINPIIAQLACSA